MDKINTVSSRAILKVSSFSMDTRLMSSSPLVNSLVKNRLFKTAPDIDEPPFQFIYAMDLSVADTMLRDSPDLVIHKTKIWAVWRPQCWTQESLAFLDAAVQLLHVRSAVCRCTVLLEQSCYQHTLRDAGSSMTSLWRHEAAVRDITIISCFVTTMKLLHALQIYPSFCEEVYAVTVFKLVQRQTIGKVRNSTMRFWTNNFCLQKWKNY